ncbi:MAG TPA: DUF6186 family protein [Acidimicrobiales bacterium]|nr:DUF6186 family protein [Acidimicrobiales bacterium]
MIDRTTALAVWAALGAVVVALEALALRCGGRVPGIGALARRITVRPVGRALLVLGWMWLGWHAFAR